MLRRERLRAVRTCEYGMNCLTSAWLPHGTSVWHQPGTGRASDTSSHSSLISHPLEPTTSLYTILHPQSNNLLHPVTSRRSRRQFKISLSALQVCHAKRFTILFCCAKIIQAMSSKVSQPFPRVCPVPEARVSLHDSISAWTLIHGIPYRP